MPQLPDGSNEILLAAVGLQKHFAVKGGFLQQTIAKVRAVDGVDLVIRRGETIALVGESGCGKTTLGRLLLRLIEPTGGDVLYNLPRSAYETIRASYQGAGSPNGSAGELLDRYSLTRFRRRRLKGVRRFMQPVFQDPFTSLDPRMLVKDVIAEPVLINRLMTKEEAYNRAAELLKEVGLRPEHLYRFPHEFSGGQRQRIAVARALAPEPAFLLLDEPTSALDVSVQAQILNLLKEIQRRQRLTYLLITHNLSVVKQMADRVDVMYLGKIVEEAPTAELFANPLHPYTRALLSAVPVPDPQRRRERIILPGDVPSPINPPSGCRFHTRCPAVMRTCGWSPRDMGQLAAFLFDGARNPNAADLPALDEVELGPRTLRLRFTTEPTDAHRALVESMIRDHRSAPGATGIMFQAVTDVHLEPGRGPRGSTKHAEIGIEFLPVEEPPLLETIAGRLVACYLYPGPRAS